MRALMIAATLLGLLLAGCVQSPGVGSNNQPSAPDWATTYSWSTGHQGHLLLDLEFDAGASNDCQATLDASFGNRTAPVLWAVFVDGQLRSALRFGEVLAVDVGAMDTRSEGGTWGFAPSFSLVEGEVSGQHSMQAFLFDLAVEPGIASPQATAALSIECQERIRTPNLRYGTDVHGLTDVHGHQGGAAAVAFIPTIAAASVALERTAVHSYETGPVVMAAYSNQFVGLGAGAVQITHPGGTERLDFTGDQAVLLAEGPAGEYHVQLTRAAFAGVGDQFFGVFGALATNGTWGTDSTSNDTG